MYLRKFLTPVVLVCLLIGQGYTPVFAQQTTQTLPPPAPSPAQQGMNNDSIVKMVKAGLSDDLILTTLGAAPGSYDVSADGVIALKAAGASDKLIAAIVLKVSAAANAAAQPAQPPPPPPMAPTMAAPPPLPPTPAASSVRLAEGTDVYLAFDEDLSSKTANEGDPVAFVLTEDIKVGDIVIAAAGAKAVGEVTHAQRSEMMGKGGELNIRLDHLKVGNIKVHLRGTKGGEGNSGIGGAIALSMLVGVFGLLHHGKEIKVQKGTALHAYVSEDVTIPLAM